MLALASTCGDTTTDDPTPPRRGSLQALLDMANSWASFFVLVRRWHGAVCMWHYTMKHNKHKKSVTCSQIRVNTILQTVVILNPPFNVSRLEGSGDAFVETNETKMSSGT